MKIGRRIQIAEALISGLSQEEIKSLYKFGVTAISFVARNLDEYEKCFRLISDRSKKVESVYSNKSHRLTGGSTKIIKSREYTGFKRKDVKR